CVSLSNLFEINLCGDDNKCPSPITNRLYQLELSGPSSPAAGPNVKSVDWHARHALISPVGTGVRASIEVDSPGEVEVEATVTVENARDLQHPLKVPATPKSFFFNAAPLPDVTRVALQRASIRPAHERGLWTLIRANTRAIGFHRYHEFISRV